MSEYVPIAWMGEDPTAQVTTIRRLHNDYGFHRFVLIGPYPKDMFGGATLADYEQLGVTMAWARAQLADCGDIELGWWLAPTLCLKAPDGSQPIVNSDGTASGGTCPLCPAFTAELKAKIIALLDKGHPSIVFIEDDYTLCNKTGQTNMKGCFCPLHLDEYAKRVGRAFTGAEIASLYDNPTEANRSLRVIFARVCCDSLVALAREIRNAIDVVDPTIRSCLCQSGWSDMDGDATEPVARALAGKTRPMVRVCGASYMNDNDVSWLPGTVAHAVWSTQHLSQDIELVHETDPYPHSRFYASTYFLGSELSAALMAGVHGSYYYCAAYTDEPLEDDGYAAWMLANRPLLEAVRTARAEMRPCGVRVVYSPAEVYLRRGHSKMHGGLREAARFLAKMGLPYTTVNDAAATVLFGHTVDALSDDEIRKIFRGGVLVDGEAGCLLTQRDFAALIGCTAEVMPSSLAYAYEEIQSVAGCKSKGRRLFTMRSATDGASDRSQTFQGQALLKPLPGTEVWSQFVDYDGKAVAPAVTYCRNTLGGRVGVLHMSPSYGYGFDAGTLHFRKQELVHRLFERLAHGRIEVAAPRTPSTWLFAAKNDKELLVMAENLCGEPRKDVELVFSAPWRQGRIARLGADGRWIEVGVVGERFHVDEAWYYPMKPVFFKVSQAASLCRFE